MKTSPIPTLNLRQAQDLQFNLVDCITEVFTGEEMLSLGDLGVVQPFNKPSHTAKVEQIIANFFGCEKALLVRGAGTGALRYALYATLKNRQQIYVHDAPIYPTTKTSLEMLKVCPQKVDYNNLNKLDVLLKEVSGEVFLVQYTRQKPSDNYDYLTIIKKISASGNLVITDDNYAAMKVDCLGAKYCQGLSTFSSFKLQGPEGVGVIVGSASLIDCIKADNYSGGSQVQGYEALECLRGLVIAPVLLATQSLVVDEVVAKLNSGDYNYVDYAFVANAQSKVIIIKLKQPIAKDLIKACNLFGAAPNPIGAESRYEIVPMIYKVSGTFLKDDPTAIDYMLRINPMRSGTQTILKILGKGVDYVFEQNSKNQK